MEGLGWRRKVDVAGEGRSGAAGKLVRVKVRVRFSFCSLDIRVWGYG